MMTKSPFLLTKQVEADIIRLLSDIDILELSNAQQQAYEQLKNSLIDARLEIQDYELAETRELQLANAKQAKAYLNKVQEGIVGNTFNAFGAVDVAHLTAYIGHISDKLR